MLYPPLSPSAAHKSVSERQRNGGNKGIQQQSMVNTGPRPNSAENAKSSLSSETHLEHWSVAGQRQIHSFVLITLSTQLLMCYDFDICLVVT